MTTEGNKALEAEAECCESFQVHSDMVEAVRCHMPEDELLDSISDTFKVFGDKTRIKILYVLHTCELCVCDIAQLLEMCIRDSGDADAAFNACGFRIQPVVGNPADGRRHNDYGFGRFFGILQHSAAWRTGLCPVLYKEKRLGL